MATTTPTTYMSGKISFSNVPQQRDNTTKDARLINCFVETLKTGDGEVIQEYLMSRPGLEFQYTDTPNGTQLPRGIYYWEGSIYTVNGPNLNKDGTTIQTLTTSFGPVGFVEFITSTNQKQLVVLDRLKGYVISTAGVVTTITDVDFPSPHVVYGVFLDGYLVVAKEGTGDIYNSDLDNPLAWTAGNFISAEMYPDDVVALVKQANYIVSFGPQTIEYFYDVGNAVGTPFGRNPSAYHKVGTTSAYSISTFEEKIIFVGNAALGGRTIFMLDGFKLVDIGTPVIRRWLEFQGSQITEVAGFVTRSKGHAFYVMNLLGTSGLAADRRTFVYDLMENKWHEWRNADQTSSFDADFATDHPSGQSWIIGRFTGAVCKFSDILSVDQDSASTSTTIKVTATTPAIDFGTMNRKFANRFTFVCTIPTTPGNSSIQLQYSDDDYQTWSTARTVTINNVMNVLHQLGQFRRRAWRFTYNSPYPFRLEGAELQYNLGST